MGLLKVIYILSAALTIVSLLSLVAKSIIESIKLKRGGIKFDKTPTVYSVLNLIRFALFAVIVAMIPLFNIIAAFFIVANEDEIIKRAKANVIEHME